jgi:hypothetical protein
MSLPDGVHELIVVNRVFDHEPWHEGEFKRLDGSDPSKKDLLFVIDELERELKRIPEHEATSRACGHPRRFKATRDAYSEELEIAKKQLAKLHEHTQQP